MARKTRVSVGDWPRLTRFYGISPAELVRMPRWLTQLYSDRLSELEAEEAMRASTVSMLPHVEQSDRDRVTRALQRSANIPESPAATVDPYSDEGKGVLAGMGIGVVIDSPGSDDG